MITAQEELEKFLTPRAVAFEKAMAWVARATFRDRSEIDAAIANLAQTIRESLILANMYGRERMLKEARAVAGSAAFAAWNPPLAKSMEFEEALEDIISREPRLAESAAEVSRLYNTGHVFAMARSSSERLTQRVQEIIAGMIRDGEGASKTEREILNAALRESHAWSNAYASTVYTTNVTGAYANGRIEQAQDPDVAQVIPALEYVGQDDARTRPNHRAAFGLIAASDDPVWKTMTPPLGYNCRCALEHVSIYELERRGLFKNGQVVRYEPPGFNAAGKDKNF